MGDRSGIEWTDATWNPVVGCSKVSPGCDNCYAISMSRRIEATGNKAYEGTTTEDGWTGLVKCLPERLNQPLRWRRPRRVFVNSMSDLFHPHVRTEFIAEVFRIMYHADRHQFQVLTKRPQRMARWFEGVALTDPELGFRTHNGEPPVSYGGTGVILPHDRWPLPNVWLGTSIESDAYAFRARQLAQTPAAVRFLSLEPLLGPLPSLALDGIDWVIVGGESGPDARPMHRSWVRNIRDLCKEQGVAFFFKQHGEWASYTDGELHADILSEPRPQLVIDKHGRILGEDEPCDIDLEPTLFVKVGKKRAGRTLDGRIWDEYPQSADQGTVT